jgi:hypothetical protein
VAGIERRRAAICPRHLSPLGYTLFAPLRALSSGPGVWGTSNDDRAYVSISSIHGQYERIPIHVPIAAGAIIPEGGIYL